MQDIYIKAIWNNLESIYVILSEIVNNPALDLAHKFFPSLDLLLRNFLFVICFLGWIVTIMNSFVLKYDALNEIWLVLVFEHLLSLFLFFTSNFLPLLKQPLLPIIHALCIFVG